MKRYQTSSDVNDVVDVILTAVVSDGFCKIQHFVYFFRIDFNPFAFITLLDAINVIDVTLFPVRTKRKVPAFR